MERSFTDGSTGYTLAYDHDGAGRPVSVTDSREPQAPLTRTFDVTGNLLELDDPVAGVTEWTWGATGNVMTRDGTAAEDFYYDLDGRMVQNWVQQGFLVLNVGTWRYDPDGQLLQDTYFETHWTTLAPDPISFVGRQYLRDDAGRVVGYGQATVDLQSGDWLHFVLAAVSYDESGRVSAEEEGIALPDGNGVLQPVASRNERYVYDDAGQLVAVEDSVTDDPLAGWQYGPNGQRHEEVTPSGTVEYGWDGVGRLDTVSPAVGDDTTYTYDGAGRRVTETTGDVSTTYEWDPAGRLVGRVATDAGSSEDLWSEVRSYAPSGQLREVVTTDHVAGETVEDRLVWDPTWPVGQLAGWTHTPDGGPPLVYEFGQGPSGVPRIDDQVGNIWLTDLRGSHLDLWGQDRPHTVAGDSTYTVWGEPEGDPGQAVWLGYRGELTTTEGLVHLRNREYDSVTGTFLSPDPLDGVDGSPTVANPYHYADNDPLNKIDPLGLSPSDGEMGLTATCGATAVVAMVDSPAPGPADIPLLVCATAIATMVAVPAMMAATTDLSNVIRNPFEGDEEDRPTPTPGPAPRPVPRPRPVPPPAWPDDDCTDRQAPQTPGGDGCEHGVLYHYTSAEGAAGIVACQCVFASSGSTNARYGDGAYFTDLAPSAATGKTAGQLSYAMYKVPWNTSKVQYWVAVDVAQMTNRPQWVGSLYGSTFSGGIYLSPSTGPVSVAGAIVGSGPTPF